jgi:dipeptidyl aminopeptidase/acylaminoacyl peptidase
MDVPEGEGPFPVVIVIHGYVDPDIYNTLTYTTRYADALARAGYIAIHPNLRGYPPSDDGPNLIRVGFARDILHLVADIQEQSGITDDPLERADAEHIGIWGHSMGGGITQRVLAISNEIDAAILYGAMSGDELRNHERIRDFFSGGTRGNWDDDATAPTAEELARISPINFISDYTAPIAIHHGTLDDQVPLEWSQELAQLLTDVGKNVEYYEYEGQPHTFVGEGDTIFIQRMIDFYDRYLKE